MMNKQMIAATLSVILLGTCAEVNAMEFDQLGSDFKRHRAGNTSVSSAAINDFVYSYMTEKMDVQEEALDFAGMAGNPAKWTGYPPKESLASGAAPTYYEIALPRPSEADLAKPELAKDIYGFNPRNHVVNRQLPWYHPLRQAAPEGLADPSLSLFVDGDDAHGTVVREPVAEMLHILWRESLSTDLLFRADQKLTNIELVRMIRVKNFTYKDLWVSDPADSTNPIFEYDENGLPINPFPGGSDISVKGPGFYFKAGENLAADCFVTVQIDDKLYALVIQRSDNKTLLGDGSPRMLSLVGGMQDIGALGSRLTGLGKSAKDTAIRETAEETGVVLDGMRLESDGLVHLVYDNVVAGEARSTGSAWTRSKMYHMHFDSLDQFLSYNTEYKFGDDGETLDRMFLDIRYVLANHIMPGVKGTMFASHGKMIENYALKDLLTRKPELLELLKVREDEHDSNMDFSRSRIDLKSLCRDAAK